MMGILLISGILLILLGVYGMNVYNSLFGVKQYVDPAESGYVTITTHVKYDGVTIKKWTDTALTVDADAFIKARKIEGKDFLTIFKNKHTF